MSPKVIYDAPATHVLVEGDTEYHGGDTLTLSDARREELLEQGIPLADSHAASDLRGLSRGELNDRALAAGVPDPESLPNRAAVAEAITAAAAAQLTDGVAGDPTTSD